MEKNKIYQVTENMVFFIKEPIYRFDVDDLKLEFDNDLKKYFTYTLSYSFDNHNWSSEYEHHNFPYLIDMYSFLSDNLQVYIRINFHRINFDINFHNNKSLYITDNNRVKHKNPDTSGYFISIQYADKVLKDVDLEVSVYDLHTIERAPKWNLYDNNQQLITNWLNNCRAVAEMFGHQVIWFHTNPSQTNYTLVNNFMKDVVGIKQIPVNLPNNEIPQDKNIYSEWDIQLEGDFQIHIVDDIFRQAFGTDELPLQKDYCYFPMLDKLYRVSSVNPKNSLYGRVGWWEVYLTKYEDDISINTDTIFENITKFEESSNLPEEFENLVKEGEFTISEDYVEKSIDEKREVTNEYSNIVVDSTNFIDLKHSEDFRRWYNKRTNIVLVNPEHNLFPVNMYDFQATPKKTIGLTYDFNKKYNKFTKSFSLQFNFVILSKFTGPIIDIAKSIGIGLQRNRLYIEDYNNGKTDKHIFDFEFIEKYFYQAIITGKFMNDLKGIQYHLEIHKLEKGKKLKKFEHIYIVKIDNFVGKIDLSYNANEILFYGNQYLINEITIFLDDKKIITDNCQPLLVMEKFDS